MCQFHDFCSLESQSPAVLPSSKLQRNGEHHEEMNKFDDMMAYLKKSLRQLGQVA